MKARTDALKGMLTKLGMSPERFRVEYVSAAEGIHYAEVITEIDGQMKALGKDKIKDGAYSKVDANTVINKNWKLSGPPFTLYRRPASGVVTALVGRPENTMLLLAEFLK